VCRGVVIPKYLQTGFDILQKMLVIAFLKHNPDVGKMDVYWSKSNSYIFKLKIILFAFTTKEGCFRTKNFSIWKSWVGYIFRCFLCSFLIIERKKVKLNWFYFFIPDGFLGFSRGVMLCNFSSKSTPIFSEGGRFIKFYDFFEGNCFSILFEFFCDSFLSLFFGWGFLFIKKIIYSYYGFLVYFF